MKDVTIYTDGCCKGNPGPGGWGAILKYKETDMEISGGCRNTTNNCMELTAVVESLKLLKEPCNVTVYTDSQYVVNTVSKGWLDSWVRDNFMTKSGIRPNVNLWKEYLRLSRPHDCKFVWIKGHNGDKYNERCDALANSGYRLCSNGD